MVALAAADTTLVRVIGVIGVILAAGNAVGGYVVTERMLKMFVTGRQEERTLRMPSASTIQTLTQLSYLVAAALFILGLKRMSSPVTAVSGVRWAGVGMLLATVVTLAFMGASSLNLMLVIGAIAVGGIIAWVSGKRVAMTDMPQMIALYNGMGGGAAARDRGGRAVSAATSTTSCI